MDDPGLKQIADWEQWFRAGHAQRLADLNLPPDQHAKEVAAIEALATAIGARLREEYRLRYQP
jgi:hypothetical protein